jgi:nitrate/nitrite transport system ATP-binding protein
VQLLELIDVAKGYGRGASRTRVLQHVNLGVRTGEIVAIVGYSGAGKTTLISLLAGIQSPDSGQVLMRGKPAGPPGPDRGVVFQNYSLLPWMSVLDNVRLGVRQAFNRYDATQVELQCRKYIDMVNLGHAVEKKPGELSGGMRQRVSLARALAMQPSVLLLDEPLSALDALTRATLQDELARISQAEQTTMVLITNDVDEAILLADRIVPLSAGPDATLGPAFDVRIPRPRDRRASALNPEHGRLKRDIIAYLQSTKRVRREQLAGVA